MGALFDAAVRAPLPLAARLAEAAALVEEHGVLVLSAAPGAGKTTLLPLALADARPGRLLLLEPRRLAARAAATRMAGLLGERVGATVGLRMRGAVEVGPATRIEVLTEGVLTRVLQDDPALEGVGTVVFDEVHERSLDGDLGLALALEARAALRPDLAVVAMSATLDDLGLAALLGGAPVLACEVPAFPVEVVWALPPHGSGAWTGREEDVATVVRRALAEVPVGDVLVFLPGAPEQRRVARHLERHLGGGRLGVDLHLLHGRADPAQQAAALAPAAPGRRKVVLATAVAETSLTIPGVRAVVDAGLVRTAAFDPRRGLAGLRTDRVSRATAAQRTGRAGRVAPGTSYRLWSEAQHARLAERPEPEIRTTDLARLALELACWGTEPGDLALLDAPPPEAWARAREALVAIDAVDGRGRATDHGRRITAAPLHPRLADLVVRAASAHGGPGAQAMALLATAAELGAGPSAGVDARAVLEDPPAEVARQASRLLRRLGLRGAAATVSAAPAGALVLDAALRWPDRLARRRPGAPGRFTLAAGGGVVTPEADPLGGAPLLLVLAADLPVEGARDAVVRLALPVDEGALLAAAGERIAEVRATRWDPAEGRVAAVLERRLGAFVVASSAVDPTEADVLAALADLVRERGLGVLDVRAADDLRSRLAFAHAHAPEEGWPAVSDADLVASVDTWLPAALARGGAPETRRRLRQVDLRPGLLALAEAAVGPRPEGRLLRVAPTHHELPSGRRVALSYEAHDGRHDVVLATRLQDLFGCAGTPRIGTARVPAVLHLLSPAGRPVQVTNDLAGFWRGSYAEVRKAMRGRYPKHPWPEDPAAAPAPPRPR